MSLKNSNLYGKCRFLYLLCYLAFFVAVSVIIRRNIVKIVKSNYKRNFNSFCRTYLQKLNEKRSKC